MTAALLAAGFAVPALALADARVIVGHFAPFDADVEATAVDVAINGEVALEDVVYGDFTDYIDLPAGDYTLEVLVANTDTVAITAEVTLEDETDYTVLATGGASGQPLALQPLVDDNSAPQEGSVRVRVVHAAPFGSDADATAVSVRLDGGTIVGGLSEVPFFAASDYLELPAGNYDLKVSTPDGGVNLIDLAPVDLPAGAVLTVIATGDGSNQPLGFTAIPLGALPTETPVDISVSGHWYTPEFSGQGFAFTPKISENRLIGSWYSWAEDGSQVWFLIDSAGPLSGEEAMATGGFDGTSALATVYSYSGGAFVAPDPVTEEPIGTLQIDFADCNMAAAEYDLGELGTGSFDLVNLTPAGVCSIGGDSLD